MDTGIPRSQEVIPAKPSTIVLFISTALHFSGSKHGHDFAAVTMMVPLLRRTRLLALYLRAHRTVYPHYWDRYPTYRRSRASEVPSLALLCCNRSASPPDASIGPDGCAKDIRETVDGSRWLTILDSWLPTGNSTEVGALLDDLSLSDVGHNQTRKPNLILSYK